MYPTDKMTVVTVFLLRHKMFCVHSIEISADCFFYDKFCDWKWRS